MIVAIVFVIAVVGNNRSREKGSIDIGILDDYVGTGISCEFDYKGVNDVIPQKREVIVNRKYEKDGYIYYHCYDLDRGEDRTFREDRIES